MNYEQLPEGVYVGCSIPFGGSSDQIMFGESTKKGTPYARVNLGILEGDQEGRSLYHDLYLTEKTIEKTVKALRSLGFKGEKLSDFQGQRPSDAVNFEITHEEYEGKVRAKVKWIGAAPKPLDAAKLDELSKTFSSVLAAPPEDDAIPF